MLKDCSNVKCRVSDMQKCRNFYPVEIAPPDGTVSEDKINDNNTIYRAIKKLKQICKHSLTNSDLTDGYVFCVLNTFQDYKSSCKFSLYSPIHKRQYQPDYIKDKNKELDDFHKEFPPKGIKLLKKK